MLIADTTCFAVVNGDFDFTKPESNMGISAGFSVIDGRLWTGDPSGRPVLAFTRHGEPVIGVPFLRIDAQASNTRISLSGVNKPIDNLEAGWIFTGQYRPRVQLNAPARVILAEQVSRPTPLPLYKTITAQVTEAHNEANELRIPRAGLAVALSGESNARVKPGDRVEVRLEATVAGKRVRDAVGGFPIVVRGEKRSIEVEVGENLRKRHPRTAVCYNRDSVIFTVVDGR